MNEMTRFPRLQDFISTINGFDALTEIPELFSHCQSRLLKRITQLPAKGDFPDFKKTISFFKVQTIMP